MNAVQPIDTSRATVLASAIERACRLVAPSWPLDRQIAVSPYWGLIEQPFTDAMHSLRRWLGGAATVRSKDAVPISALRRAIREVHADTNPDIVAAAVESNRESRPGLPLLSDWVDRDPARRDGPLWTTTITQQISQYCASYFDNHQADWHRPKDRGFFAGWRDDLESDQALLPLMHAPEIRARVSNLPNVAAEAIRWSLERLGISDDEIPDLLATCILRINGWASWCAYLGWEARLSGGTDHHLPQLLAMRLSWEALLHDGHVSVTSRGFAWLQAWRRAGREPASADELANTIWQRAQEIAFQNDLIELLTSQRPNASPQPETPPSAQLVFCIDVRSERFRRALEAADATIETRGFAGFFGLPIRYTFLGTSASRSQLPGLLSPSCQATDTVGSASADQLLAARRKRRLTRTAATQSFFRMPSSAFSLVETFGFGYLFAILRRHFGGSEAPLEHLGLSSADRATLHPQLAFDQPNALESKADLVTSILRAMGLTRNFARLCVLVGHGSQSANNPQKAALDCGACGGQTGEINARILASLLNDPQVRVELSRRGIHIPEATFAIAALHNTTTDEVHLFDLKDVPASHREDMSRLMVDLARAGQRTRAERASGLGLAHLNARPARLLREIRRRAGDWAQTRPEWGLADNAAFIVAPRSRTRHLNLAGRAFLHDYDWQHDADGGVLTLIMTAPMVVAHWINLQYFASTVDPEHFGSGNKVLHNVVGGRIGVFEGNTGDLRIGLSRQSVHDGSHWIHTPLRMSVFIEAPRQMIDKVLTRHAQVRQLVENEWLYLFRFGESAIERRHRGDWREWHHE